MLHILLLILKIIGILLAALLGIVLLVLVCILIVPVRYCIEAEGKLGGKNPVRVGIKASWLLHLINVAVVYPGAACLKVRIFCFTLFDSSSEKKRKGNKRVPQTKNAAENSAGHAEGSSKEGNGPEDNAEQPTDKIQTKEAPADAEEKISGTGGAQETEEDISSAPAEAEGEEESSEINADGDNGTDASEEKKGVWNRIKSFFLVLKQFFGKIAESLKNIEYTIKKICDKIKKISGNIQYYTEVVKSETFRKVWAVSKRQLLRIFRMLRPQICRIHLLAGTGDPAGAGQILAIYGILYPLIGNNVLIEADFENKVIEGDLFIKGRVRMLVFLLAAARLLVDKNIWRLLKMLRNPSVRMGAEGVREI